MLLVNMPYSLPKIFGVVVEEEVLVKSYSYQGAFATFLPFVILIIM